MGFKIFESSGVFNPVDCGLSIGDTINVIVVGGGGAGGASAVGGTASGGAGGPSSFGNLVTALGGSGGTAGTMPGRQGQFRGGVSRLSGQSYAVPAGGAGGWLPGVPIWGGNGGDGIYYNNTDVSAIAMPDLRLPTIRGTAGAGGIYIRRPGSMNIVQDNLAHFQYILTYYYLGKDYTQVESYAIPLALVYGGNSEGVGATPVKYGCGGIGYGAGGASGVSNANSNSSGTNTAGNSGEVKALVHMLMSVDPITFTVGGGGSGAVSLHESGATPGNDGSAGAPGLSVKRTVGGTWPGTISSADGGYGDGSVSPANPTIGTGYGSAAGGSGAGGCVAVFW